MPQFQVSNPSLQTIKVRVHQMQGSPLVLHKFSEKSRKQMLAAQEEGSKSKNKKAKEPRNPNADYEAAKHIAEEGWCGIPAAAFRNAMISACRVSGIVMTKAKLSIFIEPDGLGTDGTPLVMIRKGEPERFDSAVRLESGVASISIRPLWREWSCDVCITYDTDQFDGDSVINLLRRTGLQVGIGEGRPDSKKSTGQGWGRFEIDVDHGIGIVEQAEIVKL